MKDDKQTPTPDEPGWERRLVERLANDALVERRRSRRWGIFFKFLTFAYLVTLLVLWWPEEWGETALTKEKHTALVELKGIIAPGEPGGADNIAEGLQAAFEDKKTKGVILRINSPGGSPVQSSYIYNEIKRLREKYPKIPLYAVVSDVCASGGYYVASAADKIFVNESSIVGSIGVLMSSFGAVEAMEKLGLERRLMTAGEHKAILDPFSEFPEDEKAHVQRLLDEIHEQFVKAVKDGRGDRLKDNPNLFSGLFWTGRESVEMGLADDFASAGQVARDIIEAEDVVDYTPKEDVWTRLASRVGMAAARAFAEMTGATGLPQAR
jgi:protease-4